MVAMDLGSPPLPKKSLPVPGPLEQVANRLSSKVAAEVPHGSKQELPDLKGEWPRWQGGLLVRLVTLTGSPWSWGLMWGPRLATAFFSLPPGDSKETPAVFFFF